MIPGNARSRTPFVRMHFVRALPGSPGHARYRPYRVKNCLEQFGDKG
jgi:hypothetical protein